MLKLRWPRLSQAQLLRRAALAYLIVWVLSPPLAYGTVWRILAVLAMLLWLALDTLAPRSVLRRPGWPVLGAVVFVFYTVFLEWLMPDAAAINRQFQLWIMLFFLVVGESLRRGRNDEAKFCFWIILLVMPIWSLSTLWGLQSLGADVARVVIRSSDEARELVSQGVGGYSFVYTTLLCMPFLAYLAFRPGAALVAGQPRWVRRATKLLLLGNLMLSGLLLLRAGYTIALILSAVVVASVLLIRSRAPLRMLLSLCFVGLLVVILGMLTAPVLGVLEKVSIGTEYSAKIRDIRVSLEDDQSTGTVHDRTERYLRSLRSLGDNPVIGTLTYDKVGKHSAILDRFAQYGFAFGLLFLALLLYVPLGAVRNSRVPIGLAFGFLIVASGFPLLNNVFMAWGLILYVFSRGAFAVMGIPLDRGHRKPGEESWPRGAGAPGFSR